MSILSLGLILLQVQLASLDGIVTKPGSNEPVARATVTLNSTAPESVSQARVVVTDEDGRFTILNVAPGDYQLMAESMRYGRVLYGQRRPDGPGAILSIAGGQRITDLRLSMIPTGAITGRITGRNGEPAVNATVQAFRHGYRDGKRALQPVQIAATDDRGEYRLFWLPAGQYVVAAALEDRALPLSTIPIPPGRILAAEEPLRPVPPQAAALFSESFLLFAESFLTGKLVNRVLEDGTVQEESWAPVYYPTSTDSRFAAPVEVTPGSTTAGVNMSIGPARVQRVRGRAVGADPASSPDVRLLPQNSLIWLGATLERGPTAGSFEFRGVLPGIYYLSAQDSSRGLVSAPIPVEVGDRDVDGLQIALVPGVQIGVTMLLDSSENGRQPVAGIAARLVSEIPAYQDLVTNGQSSGSISGGSVQPGRTAFRNIPPGNYQIEIIPPRFHLKSIRFGNEEASEGIQVTDAGPRLLEIVLTTESGSLEGTVSGAGQAVVPGATVVLVPTTGRKRRNLYKSTVTNSEGRYRFEGIAPGEYKVFAWDDVETGAWQNGDFIRPYEAKGQPVHVQGNSRQDVPLTIIRNP